MSMPSWAYLTMERWHRTLVHLASSCGGRHSDFLGVCGSAGVHTQIVAHLTSGYLDS